MYDVCVMYTWSVCLYVFVCVCMYARCFTWAMLSLPEIITHIPVTSYVAK